MASETVFPEVLWAQRSSSIDAERNFVYLTISVPDVPAANMKLDLQPAGLTFEGRSETLKRTYRLELAFYGEIDPAESKVNHSARDVELKLRKKELSDAYWPRLLKDAKKVHFLKTDFDRWVDEDEQDETAAEDDFGGMGGMGGMPGMGGMGGMGMPGMGGMGGMGDFGGLDFSKLGGGAAGSGMPDMPDSDDDLPDGDDDDMPALEGDDEGDSATAASAEGKGKGKEVETPVFEAAEEAKDAKEEPKAA